LSAAEPPAAARFPYASPSAFRRALTDRLARIAAPHGSFSLSDLQRQVAYDRLLCRLYTDDARWILKGAGALLARRIGARRTGDLDVSLSVPLPIAVESVRRAAALDLGDWFEFGVGDRVEPIAGVEGTRLAITASLGRTVWSLFGVDVVVGAGPMQGPPDEASVLVDLSIPGLLTRSYRLWPLENHVADKVTAVQQTFGVDRRPSTRYRDLVDLAAIAASATVAATSLRTALLDESSRRGAPLPTAFALDDTGRWRDGYAAIARRLPASTTLEFDDALALVRRFIGPILDGSASGAWDPAASVWR
jgi:hypothetical protein